PPPKSWWTQLTEWLGKNDNSWQGSYVTLKSWPAGDDIFVLKDCHCPVISPDRQTLAVIGSDYALQLWDFPIRKPIGKILGLAGLEALATLLAFNGLSWLRRRRMRLKANLVANSVPSTK